MTMPIQLNLPPGAEVFNRLYETRNPELLDEDLLTIRLENGFCVDAGWFPAFDPHGTYVVRVFYEYGDADVRDPIYVADVREVADIVERLCARFGRRQVNVSRSNSEFATAVA